MNQERAGVLVIRDGRIAVVERVGAGQKYWVLPGGGVELHETVAQAAQREGEEELGVPVRLGSLRLMIDHRESDGTFQRQWYFDAAVDTDDIRFVGPELDHGSDESSYVAVWLDLDVLEAREVLPIAVARFVGANKGVWPPSVVEIDER